MDINQSRSQYAAFQFYRGKGWMPRSGLQYGAHFVLYRRHPALCHSDYAVVVVPPPVRGYLFFCSGLGGPLEPLA